MVIHQDNLAFSVINDNEVKVLHLYPRTSEVTHLVIPPHVQGYRVSVIAKKAFYECTKLRRVTLPSSLRSIEDEAFGLCDKLEEINLPDSIAHVGKAAFEGTLALKKVVLPRNLSVLPEALFYDSAVSDMTLPDNITEIPTVLLRLPQPAQHRAARQRHTSSIRRVPLLREPRRSRCSYRHRPH